MTPPAAASVTNDHRGAAASQGLEIPPLDRKAVLDEIGGEALLKHYRDMLQIRRFEERCVAGARQKKIAGFLHLYIGQEAVATGLMAHTSPEQGDSAVTSYRDHGQALLLGLSSRELMAELFGKVTGNVRGKGGSMHFFSDDRSFLGGHGIVGGQTPIGTGAAFAAAYLGTGGVSLTFMGDGASAQGTLHESLNLASLLDLPAIYIIENNEYGMGTACSRAVAVEQIAEKKAPGYDIPGVTVDGTDFLAMWSAGKAIVGYAREHSRPVLVEAKTVRFTGHSISDAQPYRTREDIDVLRESKDCLSKLALDLQEAGLAGPDDFDAIDAEIRDEMADAWTYADESPEPPLSELKRHVFAE